MSSTKPSITSSSEEPDLACTIALGQLLGIQVLAGFKYLAFWQLNDSNNEYRIVLMRQKRGMWIVKRYARMLEIWQTFA